MSQAAPTSHARRYAHGFAAVGDVRLHYLEWPGRAPVVLCLPGITANAHAFVGLADAVGPSHVIAMDLRGRGGSDKPEVGYDVATHAADAAEVLANVGVAHCVVVGWSLGAKVALALAAARPDLVERLVLIDPPVATPPMAREALRAFWHRLDNTYPSVDAFLESMRASGRFSRYWGPIVEAYLRADVETGEDGLVRHRVPRFVPEAELDAESTYPTPGFYSWVSCPVLILRAPEPLVREGDQVLGAADAAAMRAALTDAHLVEVTGADHFSILLELPLLALKAIQDFVGTNQRVVD